MRRELEVLERLLERTRRRSFAGGGRIPERELRLVADLPTRPTFAPRRRAGLLSEADLTAIPAADTLDAMRSAMDRLHAQAFEPLRVEMPPPIRSSPSRLAEVFGVPVREVPWMLPGSVLVVGGRPDLVVVRNLGELVPPPGWSRYTAGGAELERDRRLYPRGGRRRR